jgi:arylsulfatase A-like enzyme
LGEHNEWGKQTNFEVALRIPYIIRDPRFPAGRTKAFAELIDMYMTLSDLAGAPPPEPGVQGTSLAAVVQGLPTAVPKTAAFSQMARCFGGKAGQNDSYTAWSQPDACTMAAPADIEYVTPRHSLMSSLGPLIN